MSKKTYGQQLEAHNAQNLAIEDDVIEYRRQWEQDILKKIDETIQSALESPIYKNRNFYVVLLTKKEKLGGVPRVLILARLSCPTPTYNQTTWKYYSHSGSLEYLWSIPDSVMYYHVLRNKDKYLTDKETTDTARFIILMESGELLEWVKKENGEKRDAVIFNKPTSEDEACLKTPTTH